MGGEEIETGRQKQNRKTERGRGWQRNTDRQNGGEGGQDIQAEIQVEMGGGEGAELKQKGGGGGGGQRNRQAGINKGVCVGGGGGN